MEGKECEFVKFTQDMGEISGMDRVLSAIFAIVYVEPGEISLEEIAEKSGYSLSSVSVKVNMLESLGLVRKSRKPSMHKVFVYMEKDMGRLLREVMLEKQRRKFQFAKERLPQIIENYRKRASGENERKKLAIMENYYTQLGQIHDTLDKVALMLDKCGE